VAYLAALGFLAWLLTQVPEPISFTIVATAIVMAVCLIFAALIWGWKRR
jgi:hypothetical protein